MPAQETAAAPHWSYEVEPYLWLPSISGSGSTDTSPPLEIDLHGEFDAGLPLAFSARSPSGRFRVLADALYVRLKDDEGPLRSTTQVGMAEAGLGVALDSEQRWHAIAGLRYIGLDYDVSLLPIMGSSGADWVDPWVGATGELAFNRRWSMRVRGDVGGFGVGTEFSWQTMAALRASLGKSVLIDLGYRAIGLDFNDDDLHYDAVIHGPVLGIGVSF